VAEWPSADNDRAVTMRMHEGLIRVLTRKNGRMRGAPIVGAQAGELIGLWVLATSQGMRIRSVASLMIPVPTVGELRKRAAGAWFAPSLFRRRTARLGHRLQRVRG